MKKDSTPVLPNYAPVKPKRYPAIRITAAFACLAAYACPAFGQAAAGGDAPALDPVTGVVHSRRLASGVPLGGVGTGTFQLLTDGTISRATLTNNWQQPTGDLPGCFAALWTRTGTRTQAHVLALSNAYGLPTIKMLDFGGLPPQALLNYGDTGLPLTVSCRAFSPLVPFDLKNSSLPAAAFVFQFRNTSAEPIEISIALSWENVLGRGGTAAKGAFGAATSGAIMPLPAENGIFGLHFTGPPLTPGTSAEERLRDNATGDMALLALPRKDSTVTQTGWNAAGARPDWWEMFAKQGDVSGGTTANDTATKQAAGVVSVRFTLKPHDSVEIPFAVAWHTPHYYTLSGVDYGRYDAKLFADAPKAGRALLSEWRSLLALTEEWQQSLRFSNLPRWLVRRLISSVTPLQTNTLHTEDGKFAFLRSAGGAGGSQIVAPESDPALNALLSDFLPTLQTQAVRPGVNTVPAGAGAFVDAEYSLNLSPPDERKAALSAPGLSAALSAPGLSAALAAAIAQIAAGKPDEGIAALQAWDENSSDVLLSPWIAPESASDASALAASPAQAGYWPALAALTGFRYDAGNSMLTLTPHLPGTWRSLRAPIFAPNFWASLEYKPRAHGGLITFRLDRLIPSHAARTLKHPASNMPNASSAEVLVSTLRVPGPPPGDSSPLTVHISLFQTPQGSKTAVDPATGDLILTLDTPLALTAGDRLEIEVH